MLAVAGVLVGLRAFARARRRYVRATVVAYRTDRASPEAAVAMFEALHAAVLQRWWRRLLWGQGSVAVEVQALAGRGSPATLLALACPVRLRPGVEAALRTAYSNMSVERVPVALPAPRACCA
jgi:hypothetical protein